MQTQILSILLRIYTQRKELIKNLKKVNIFALENDSGAYNKLKLDVFKLKEFTDEPEMIFNYYEDKTGFKGKIQNFISLLKNLRFFMHCDKEDEKNINKDRQFMLVTLGFHNYLINFLENGKNI